MTKRLLSLGWASILAIASLSAHAQTPVTLGTSPYVENFDGLASGLPAGFGVYVGATATNIGVVPTAAQLILTPSAAVTTATPPLPAATSTAWTATAPGFKNFASNTALSSTTTADAQAAATDRALGVRQAGSFGDGTSGNTPVGPAFVFQIANTTGKTDFALSFKLESLDAASPRTTIWRVDYGVGATPTAFTQVGTTATTGPVFSNNTLTASFGGALDNLAGPVWIRIVAPTVTTGSGNRPTSAIDDFSLSWNANANAPTLAVAPATLAFGNQAINTTSAAQTYTLTGTNLTADATVTATAPFSVSKDNATFGLTATYTAAELAAGVKPVYVKFTPTTTAVLSGPVTGTITNSSTGATSRTVTVTGAGTDPSQTVYSFSNCVSNSNLSDGWTQVSVTGAQTWGCTTFGRDPNAPNGTTAYPTAVQINGYAGGANNTNEDWLISPALPLASTTYPLLSYWTRSAFAGPQLRLLISTNYSGSGSPVAAGVTWTDLNAAFPAAGSDTWTQTSNVDLSAYKMAGVYVAFVYNSTTDEGSRWTLDDVVLTNSATPAPPTLRASVQSLGFGYRAVGTSTVQTMNVTANSLTSNLTVTSSNDAFQFSKDGAAFSSTLTYTPADISGKTLPVQVRFQPTAASTAYSATATVATTGATSQVVTLSGNTYDVANTLELVNWNMEWFGSSAAGFGPDNKDLQYTNASTVIKALNADVYALLEVVDTVRLRTLVASMPGYAYRISDFGSNADDKADNDYTLTQKLAFVYRTSVVTDAKFSAFFRSRQADAAPDYSYWSSGRFPFVMQANVTLNGVTKPVTFVAIHAKANTDPVLTSYNRRKSAADELKAKLDADYAGQNVAILGDFNDDLDQTITAGVTPATTSYSAFTSDAANYPSPTLQELSLTGKKSTVSYNDVIDHVVTSKSLYNFYLRGTAEVQTGITSTIANYGSTTSDHYPVLTRYAFNSTLATKASRTAALGLYPNPVSNSVRFDVPETGKDLSLQVYTTTGRLVLQGKGSVEQLNQQLNQRVGGLAAGLYVVRVIGAQQTYTDRFEKH
jgi:hypothetical protein